MKQMFLHDALAPLFFLLIALSLSLSFFFFFFFCSLLFFCYSVTILFHFLSHIPSTEEKIFLFLFCFVFLIKDDMSVLRLMVLLPIFFLFHS